MFGRRALLSLFALFVCTFAQAQTWQPQWSQYIDPVDQTAQRPYRIIPSADGGAYIIETTTAGAILSLSHTETSVLVKIDLQGRVQWQTRLGMAAQSMAEGKTGIFVAGACEGPVGFLCKLDFAGRVLWRKYGPFFSGGGFGYVPNSFHLDKDDNVFFMYPFRKYDANGKLLWTVTPTVGTSLVGPDNRVTRDFNIDSTGSLIFQGLGQDGNVYAIKINPDGSQAWAVTNLKGADFYDCAVSPDGSVYVSSGQTRGLADGGALVNSGEIDKYSPQGMLVWKKTTTCVVNIATDSLGNLYSNAVDSTSNDYMVTGGLSKIAPNGQIIWHVSLPASLSAPYLTGVDQQGFYLYWQFNENFVQRFDANGVSQWKTDFSQIGQANAYGGKLYVLKAIDLFQIRASLLDSSKNTIWQTPNLSTTVSQAGNMVGCTDENGVTFFWGLIDGPQSQHTNSRLAALDSDGNTLFIEKTPGNGTISEPVESMFPAKGGGAMVQSQSHLSKIDVAGNIVWQKTLDGPIASRTTDASGNVLGWIGTIAFKLSANGTLLWQTAPITGGTFSGGPSISSVDKDGNFIGATGGQQLVKVSPTGNVVWILNNTPRFNALVEDASGNIYATYPTTIVGDMLNKYDKDGNLLFSTQMVPGDGTIILTAKLLLDRQGNVVVVGTQVYDHNQLKRLGIDKLTAGGQMIWHDGIVLGIPQTAFIDSRNHILVEGASNSPTGFVDYFVADFTPDGALGRYDIYNSPLSLSDHPNGFGFDSHDNIYIFGVVIGPSFSGDFHLMKYGQPTEDDAAILSQSTNLVMAAGQSYPVTISVQNTGINTWTAAGGYKLDCLEPTTWGIASVSLANGESIAPGGSKVFNASVIAPTTPGTYPLQWRMEHSGTRFGGNSPMLNVSVIVQTNFAQFVSQSIPSGMIAGQSYPVNFKLKNIGQTTWTTGAGYKLQSQSPIDNTIWGTNRMHLVDGPVAPGAIGTFAETLIAPPLAGSYSIYWRGIQDTTGLPFGPTVGAQSIAVTAAPDAARFISRAGSSAINTGTDFYVQITMRNVGSNIWKSSTGYSLMTINPDGNTIWGSNNIAIPGVVAAVGPNAQVTFTRLLTAPITPGSYPMQWQMVHNGRKFGDATPLVNYNVYTGRDNAGFVSQTGVPLGIGVGATFNASFTMKNLGTEIWDGVGYSLASIGADFGVTSIPASSTTINNTCSFSAKFTAPSTPGTYVLQYRMQHLLIRFGQATQPVTITVGLDSAKYVSFTGSTSLFAGADFNPVFTMQNTGANTWTQAGGYALLSLNPQSNTLWAVNRLLVPSVATVAPGDSVGCTNRCMAPVTPGTYTMQWQMAKNGVVFGEKTALITIQVFLGPDDAQFFRQDNVPTTVVHGTTFNATVIMQNLGTSSWDSSYSLVPIGTSNFGIASIVATSTARSATDSFSRTFTAPSTPGVYRFQWRMMHAKQFGQASAPITITVT